MTGVLEIRDLHKRFDTHHVIKGFSLDVAEQTLSCLVGPNGAGKTTLMDLITGRLKPSSGSVKFHGDEMTSLSENEIARRGIGRKFQIPAVFKQLTVRENLEVAYSRQVNPFVNMFRFSDPGMNSRLDEVSNMVALQDRLRVEAGLLSHGETQWLEIGMVLMQEPRLLLLDEPIAGMTEAEIEKTARLLREIRRSATLIVVEHDMGFVREISDVVTVMHMGTLLAQGPIDVIEADSRVRDVYLGTDEEVA
ncbi:urea ABC transporter ATP-binding protein UrtD [Pseudomonas sp. 7P_10.2_Bac1]|uniref:urea ABC transporter ATP-binding protein UrtD n=1 Tax=Pseudomonas sp. 7P_10.2_Bac1 TaxID=2971614 RepID=UPI0021C8BC6B|nr:urea ABC transporter ATP-binding protein UrtD [Pseudomonas sp. 7P_10.2_Bac1]MCU1727058.1 urea ABC transporter ATP-binding protein UrtD [Pseudomonas sp. 7P_10.2_Bac1]